MNHPFADMSVSLQLPSAKAALRTLMRTRLKAAAGLGQQSSRALLFQIQSHPVWAEASTVALFAPLPEEPDLLGLLEHPAKRFVFPCLQGANLLWRAASTPADLRPAPHTNGRLREPVHGEWVSTAALDCVLVPGLAFTTCGRRLGRGGGYYDRTLAALGPQTVALGVCFSLQIVDSLPAEPHDQPVHAVLHA
jgi:5-formyltetrahydrofolate cyclo-ligase